MYPGRWRVSGTARTLIARLRFKKCRRRTKICRCGEHRGSRVPAYNYDMPLAATRAAWLVSWRCSSAPGSPARRAACSGWRCRPCPPPWIPRSPRTRPPGCWRGRSSTPCVSTARARATWSPALATQWQVSRDGLTWSFRLRDGVRFHDGTPLAAADGGGQPRARALPGRGRRARRQPVVPRLLRGTPGVVKAVRVPDPRTVQIVLALPYAPLLTVLAHPALAIVRVTSGADGSARWVGTGPFLVAESAAGPGRCSRPTPPTGAGRPVEPPGVRRAGRPRRARSPIWTRGRSTRTCPPPRPRGWRGRWRCPAGASAIWPCRPSGSRSARRRSARRSRPRLEPGRARARARAAGHPAASVPAAGDVGACAGAGASRREPARDRAAAAHRGRGRAGDLGEPAGGAARAAARWGARRGGARAARWRPTA